MKTDFRHRLFGLVFFLPVLTLAHGGLVKGTVRDSVSQQPLPGASVLIPELGIAVQTDALGNFSVDNLPDGAHRLRISFLGYQTTEANVSVVDGATILLSISLVPASLDLKEVTVAGQLSPQEAMTTISRIDLALRPVKSSQEILRMVPGVVTAQHAGGGKAEQIFLRGFDIDHGTDISLTVDGMPVNMVSHAHGQGYADLHFLIPEVIDHVDFNKGPYDASVGDFNTAGYANFQSRNRLTESSVKLEGGSFDTYRALGMFNLLDNSSVGQSAYVAAEYLYTNGPFVSPQHFNRINLFGKFSSRIGDDGFLSASLSTFSSEWDASGQIPERAVSSGLISRFGAIDDTEGGETGRTNASLSFVKYRADGSSIRNQVYLSRYDFDLYSNFTFFLNDPVNGDAIRQREERMVYGYQGAYNTSLHVGERRIAAELGAGIRYDDIDDVELSRVRQRYTFLEGLALGDIDQINANAYGDLRFNLSRRFTINAGVRLDAFSFQYADKLASGYDRKSETATVVSPKINFFYNASNGIQLYVKSGYGFHSNDARVVVQQRARQILPKAFGTDIGIFAKPVSSLLLNLAVWQLNLEQEFVYVGDEAVVEPSGETQRYGVDLSVRYQPFDELFIDFDGNYSHARSVEGPEGENYIPLAPTFTSIAGLTATLAKGWHASLRYRLIADRPANEDNSVTAKGYFLLDAAMTYRFKNVELSVSGNNLLDREWNEAQFDTFTRLPGEAEGASELTFTPGDPFFIRAGARFMF